MKEKLKARKLTREIFINDNGAIDLASIMVGIIVIGIIGGVIAATIFAIIPWSQDNAAKNSLDSVRTAESAYSGFSADKGAVAYGDLAGLINQNQKLLSSSKNLNVVLGTDSKCYTAIIKSDSGNVFYTESNSDKAERYTNQTATCNGVTLSSAAAAVSSSNGTGATTVAGAADYGMFGQFTYFYNNMPPGTIQYNVPGTAYYQFEAYNFDTPDHTPGQYTNLPFINQYEGVKNLDITKTVTNVYIIKGDGTKNALTGDGTVEAQTNSAGLVNGVIVSSTSQYGFKRATDDASGYDNTYDYDNYVGTDNGSVLHFTVDGVDQHMKMSFSGA